MLEKCGVMRKALVARHRDQLPPLHPGLLVQVYLEGLIARLTGKVLPPPRQGRLVPFEEGGSTLLTTGPFKSFNI